MQANPVRWFEIYVQDISRAKQFYESVFQRTLERLDSQELELWAFPMSMTEPGVSGAIAKMEGVPSGGNSTIVYFGCDDCSVEASRIPKFGGRIHRDKLSIGQYGYIVLAFDPDGNMFGLHSLQ